MIIKTGIEIDTTNQFSNPTTFEESGVQSSITATGLQSETGYYVRAYVVDDQGNRIDSENTESFTTLAPPIILNYFYIENLYNGQNNITLKKTGTPISWSDLSYSTDGDIFNICTFDSNNEWSITLDNLNDKLYFRSTTGDVGTPSVWNHYYNFQCAENFKIGGDIRTLMDYTDVSNINTLQSYSPFCYLFKDNVTLISANLFDVSAIQEIRRYGFAATFKGCSNLLEGIDLRSITTISDNVFSFAAMYQNCSSMNLIYAPNVSSWSENGFQGWVDGVAATGTMYCPSGVTISTGNNGIPTDWTRVDY